MSAQAHGSRPAVFAEDRPFGIVAEFANPGAILRAAEKVRAAGFTKFDTHTPFPIHGMDRAMGLSQSKLPFVTLVFGLTGTCSAALLQWWMNAHNWPWNVSGKPTWSIPANIPIAYETTILLSVLTTFFGMWAANKLPQVWHPFFRLDRFAKVTDDGLFLGRQAQRRYVARDGGNGFVMATAVGVDHKRAGDEVAEDASLVGALRDCVR